MGGASSGGHGRESRGWLSCDGGGGKRLQRGAVERERRGASDYEAGMPRACSDVGEGSGSGLGETLDSLLRQTNVRTEELDKGKSGAARNTL